MFTPRLKKYVNGTSKNSEKKKKEGKLKKYYFESVPLSNIVDVKVYRECLIKLAKVKLNVKGKLCKKYEKCCFFKLNKGKLPNQENFLLSISSIMMLMKNLISVMKKQEMSC